MNKLFLRLFVAWMCFSLALEVTNLVRYFRGVDASMEPVALKCASRSPFYDDEMQIRAIYREYGPAQTRRERAFFEQVETDDFILFLGDERISREEDIRSMENSQPVALYTCYPERIDIFGDRAIADGRMEARYGNGTVDQWGFVDVWVKRGDVWQIQSTTSVDSK